MVVLPDADVGDGGGRRGHAGYGSAGERCMAISVVVAVGAVADPLVEAIKARLPELRVGPGDDPDSEMGPLITREHRDRVAGYLERAAGEGATLVVDGRESATAGRRLLPRRARCSTASRRGHGTATTTRSSGPCSGRPGRHLRRGAAPRQRQPVRQRHGHLHPRRWCCPPVPVRRARSAWSASTCRSRCPWRCYSFGGWKASLFGDTHMYGPEGVAFYTRSKVVTSRWPDPGHRPSTSASRRPLSDRTSASWTDRRGRRMEPDCWSLTAGAD